MSCYTASVGAVIKLLKKIYTSGERYKLLKTDNGAGFLRGFKAAIENLSLTLFGHTDYIKIRRIAACAPWTAHAVEGMHRPFN